MTVGMAVRERILQLCRERGITVNKLAVLSGVTQSTLNNIVGGRNHSTTVSTLQKVWRWAEYHHHRVLCQRHLRRNRAGNTLSARAGRPPSGGRPAFSAHLFTPRSLTGFAF